MLQRLVGEGQTDKSTVASHPTNVSDQRVAKGNIDMSKNVDRDSVASHCSSARFVARANNDLEGYDIIDTQDDVGDGDGHWLMTVFDLGRVQAVLDWLHATEIKDER